MTTSRDIDTEVRSIGTCKACAASYVLIGTIRRRNGSLCICATPELVHHSDMNGRIRQASTVLWSTVKATVTERECGAECRNAKSAKCACSCGGDNHGCDLMLSLIGA